MGETTYKLEDLAKAAGTSPRTVRYYVQRGLLPAPVFRGKDTAYAHEHLVRLRAIRRLQEAHLPLEAIAVELSGKSIGAIERIADEPRPRSVHAVHVARPEPSEPEPTTWRRVEVVPGLELHVAADASPDAKRLFERLLEAASSLQ